MASLKSVVKVLAVVVGGFVALVVFVFIGLGSWMWFSNHKAGAEAADFCASIRTGDSLAVVKARAEPYATYGEPWADQPYHRFKFPGWGLHECQVTADGDRVTGKRVNNEAFD
jgi:hypothetical protein